MLWELRLRTPRRIDDVVIETDIDDEAEARRLAEAYIATLQSPATRYIYIRKLIVARSKDFPKPEDSGDAAKTARRASGEQPTGRIGA
jgi:hypothetical protein